MKIQKIRKMGKSGGSLRPWLSQEPQLETTSISGVFFALKLFSFCSNDFFSKFYRLIQVPRRSINFGLRNIIQHVSRLPNADQGTPYGSGAQGQGLRIPGYPGPIKKFILLRTLFFEVLMVNVTPN